MLNRNDGRDEVQDDTDAAFMGFPDKRPEIFKRAVIGMDVFKIGDFVTVMAARHVRVVQSRCDRQHVNRVDAQLLNVIQFADQSFQITFPVAVAVGEAFDEHVIHHDVFVPLVTRVFRRFR